MALRNGSLLVALALYACGATERPEGSAPEGGLEASEEGGRDSGEEITIDSSMLMDASRDAPEATDALPDVPGPSDSARPLPVPPPDYPPGPYGSSVGETLPYLAWEGYVTDDATGLASERPYVLYTADDVRRSGAPFALIHVSEFGCPGCKNAAADLATLGKSVVDAGGLVVEVLGSFGFFDSAKREHLEAWIEGYDLTVTTVIDQAPFNMQTIEALGLRETAVVVDASTLKVVWRVDGDTGGTGPSSINAATDEMLRLLGQ